MREGDRQMKQSIRLGRVAGIPIGLHWTVVVIVALITGMLAASVLPAIIPHQPAGGLWLMLVGWILVTAARAEQQSEAVRGALAGLRVRDIMLAHPDTGAAWSDVADFTSRVVLSSWQTVFPVVSFDGGLAGVVFAEALARVPPADRATTRLGQVATPVPLAYLAGPDATADSLTGRPPLRGQLLGVVVEDRQVTGIVTTDELRLAMLRARLQAGQPGWARR